MGEQRQLSSQGLRGELRRDEPMARHVSWRAGGRVRQAYLPADLEDLALFLRGLPAQETVYFVGLGSNLLVRDGGLDATVIFTHRALREVAVVPAPDGGEISAGAGVACPKVARLAALNGLAGAEFLAGIPGTLGGALAMNAGCYGGETWQLVKSVRTVDRSGALHLRGPGQYSIGYRSVQWLKAGHEDGSLHLPGGERRNNAQEWFVGATLQLGRGDTKASRDTIQALLAKRIASQPLGQPNAGSVFRNPPQDHAARLIEAAGLKGHRVGGASISAKHANFIVNDGNATAADIEALICLAQQAVSSRFGILLEREVRLVGEAA